MMKNAFAKLLFHRYNWMNISYLSQIKRVVVGNENSNQMPKFQLLAAFGAADVVDSSEAGGCIVFEVASPPVGIDKALAVKVLFA